MKMLARAKVGSVMHTETDGNTHFTISVDSDGLLHQQQHGPDHSFTLTGVIADDTVHWYGTDADGNTVTGSDRQVGEKEVVYCRIVWGDNGNVLHRQCGTTQT